MLRKSDVLYKEGNFLIDFRRFQRTLKNFFLFWVLVKIQVDIIGVILFSKFFDNKGLSDLSGALHQKTLPLLIIFPFQKRIVYFSFQHRPHLPIDFGILFLSLLFSLILYRLSAHSVRERLSSVFVTFQAKIN